MQGERQPEYPLLYSLQGFRYVDLLLEKAERAAWRVYCGSGIAGEDHWQDASVTLLATCEEAERRASQTLEWVTTQNWLLDIALDQLSLARARLYGAIPGGAVLPYPSSAVEEAVRGLRRSGDMWMLPKALLTAALNAEFGMRNAELGGVSRPGAVFLDEAEEIARRGPMPLFLADVHLHRARLYGDREELGKARVLIERCGYWRRKGELEDAEAVISNQ